MEFSVNSISLVDIVIIILLGLCLLVMHREEKKINADREALRASMETLKAEQNAMKDEDESGVH